MKIGCTKKLQDYLKISPCSDNCTAEPLFSWSANLITLNRRKAIVVMNDASYYGFILYGITAKVLKDLDNLILRGIRSCLEHECIDPELVCRYMSDGEGLIYSKTANRSVVTRLNQLCQKAEYFSNYVRDETVLQTQLLRSVNDDIYKIDGSYRSPNSLLCSALETYFSVPNATRCRAAVLDVTLELESPCSRRIAVPMSYTFDRLHKALQCLFCWQNYHLHEFVLSLNTDGTSKDVLVCAPSEDDFAYESERLDTEVCLSDVFPATNTIYYNYDFGDGWSHNISLVEIIEDYDKAYPTCISADGDAPPEDVGGAGGYTDFLRILSNPDDPEYMETKLWATSMMYKPTDLVEINWRLKDSV